MGQIRTMQLSSRTKILVVTKARQVGVSDMLVRYSLWLSMFHHQKVLCLSHNRAQSDLWSEKLRDAYESLPQYIRNVNDPVLINRDGITFKLGGHVRSASEYSGSRGEEADTVFLDEAAWMSREAQHSVYSLMSAKEGTRAIIASSLHPDESNWFNDMRVKAMSSRDFDMMHCEIPWYSAPNIERMKEIFSSLSDERHFSLECLCMYPKPEEARM